MWDIAYSVCKSLNSKIELINIKDIQNLSTDDLEQENLPKVLEQYDRDVLKYLLDRPTLTAIDNLSGFIKKMDDTEFQKILDRQK